MTSRTLTGTYFEFVYRATFSSSDEEFISKGVTFIALGTMCIALSRLLKDDPFPYGKGKEISDKTSSLSRAMEFLPISAKSAWKYSFMPTIIIPILVLLFTPARYVFYPKNAIALGFAYFHCFYRTIFYSSKISRHAHPVGILVALAMFAVHVVHTFYVVHGMANVLSPETFTFPVCCGAIITAFGVAMNHYHDAILTALRDEGKGYQIPMGGLFTWISCPHYFGEIVEWWGVACVTRAGPEIMFAIFTTVMLGLRARDSNTFYNTKFPKKYPFLRRKIVFPFIY